MMNTRAVVGVVRRSRRHVIASVPPLTKCDCGLDKFWDESCRRWLCPARFDGEHDLEAREAMWA